jgi:hypothetical protein
MAEIDPWALPQGGAGAPGAATGIPGKPAALPRAASAGRVLPILVTVAGSIYVVASIIEIFIVNSQVSLANQFNLDIANGNVPADAIAQANASDSHINAGALVTGAVYLAVFIFIVVWERRLKFQLGTVGARRAVLNRAGYNYFRATWLVSFLLGLYLAGQSKKNEPTIQEVISHDHRLMLYYGLRALLGAIMVLFAVRLMRISEDGFARVDFGRVNRDSFYADAFKDDGF